jgi:FKBP-type peptidyl-prolyl cis-trans isomerase (trigger factor)
MKDNSNANLPGAPDGGAPINERDVQRRLTDLIERITRRKIRSLDDKLRDDLGFTDASLEDFNRDIEIEFGVRVENITECDMVRDLLDALLEALTPEDK